ncbi:MAG: hypothetical protein ACE5GB_11015 [Acidimicrobiales bacterium]
MSDQGPDEASDPLEELRRAAGATLASLRWMIDSAQRVVDDPESFQRVIDEGRAIIGAFTSGLVSTSWLDDDVESVHVDRSAAESDDADRGGAVSSI